MDQDRLRKIRKENKRLRQQVRERKKRIKEFENDARQNILEIIATAQNMKDEASLKKLVTKVKTFIQDHPWITITIVVAATAAGIALGYVLVQYGVHVVVGEAMTKFATFVGSKVGAAYSFLANSAQELFTNKAGELCTDTVFSTDTISDGIVIKMSPTICNQMTLPQLHDIIN